jgi:hypothetical protein
MVKAWHEQIVVLELIIMIPYNTEDLMRSTLPKDFQVVFKTLYQMTTW